MGGAPRRWARLILIALLCIGARAAHDSGEALVYEVPLEIAVAALVRDYLAVEAGDVVRRPR